ncbi:MAG: rhodanese-like domain-containing protein [Bacteroidetes bacterium]|nr:rhodanese-like domain-containing protein [Bacteroidota bacterium]NCQ12073.1 rhodanese-like domain-containing protein [Bacteroidota bacterium]
MKIHYVTLTILFLTFANQSFAQKAITFDEWMSNFSYDKIGPMQVDANGAKVLLATKKAVLLDIRFDEERATWQINSGIHIPANELPKRLKELDKNTLYIVACPHETRSEMSMLYLTTKGYKAKFLKGGLMGLMDSLRGGNALDFQEMLKN